MPDINISPLRDIPGATEATTATFEAIAMRSLASSSVRVSGAEVVFPDKIRARYTDGAWDVQPALAALPVGDYWSVTLTDVSTSKSLRRTVILPVGTGPFDFGQLVNITPGTGQPDPSLPVWEVIVEQVTEQATIAAGAAAGAVDAAVDAEQARLGALGYRTESKDARDESVAARNTAQGAATAAGTAAGTATGAASTATSKAAEAVTAAAGAGAAAAAAVAPVATDLANLKTALPGTYGMINGAPIEGYDIVLLMGQSNMSGRGTPFSSTTDPINPRIFQYRSGSPNANTIQPASEPLSMHDTPSGIGPGLQFARWYAARRLVGNRKVLLVPVAHGGTPLVSNAVLGWRRGVSGNLYANAVARVAAALVAGGSGSRIVAALWLQGETDGDANVTGAAYLADFDAMLNGLRTDLNLSALPIVVGTMVPEYLSTGTRAQINAVHRDTPNRILGTDVAVSAAGANLGDGNHFNATGQRYNGRAMFDAYERIAEGIKAYSEVYAPAAPTVTLGTVTSTSVSLSWVAVEGAVSYQIAYRVAAGSWVNGPSVAGTTGTVTGLTGSTGYEFRVAGLSAAGIYSPNSNVVSATTVAASTTLGVTATPQAAYSLSRRVNTSYSGPLFRVRRSSDNVETDIPQASGVVDAAALATAVGSSDAFVTALYDQSGFARHLTQATAAAQPRVATAGTLVTSGGKLAFTTDGTDDVLFIASDIGLLSSPGVTSAMVLKAAAPAGASRSWAESNSASSSNQYGHAQPNNAGSYSSGIIQNTSGAAVATGTAAMFNGAIHQISAVDTTAAYSQWLDAAVDVNAVAYTGRDTAGKNRFAIGGVVRSGSLAPFAMTFSELALWGSALGTTDRQTVEANQKAFYGTP
jgi:hypothetical protein